MTTTTTTIADAPPPDAAAAGPGQSAPADAGNAAQPADAEAKGAAPGDAGAADGDAGGTEEAWAKARQATNRSGAGSARREHSQAAKNAHSGDKVQGDKIAGHKFVLNLGGRPVVVPELSPDLADPVRFAFVNPRNWDELRRRFRASRTAIVRGRTGSGKDANAIRLLQGEVQTIYYLERETSIARLADSITEKATRLGGHEGGIGFLLCQPVRAHELTIGQFHALHTALDSTNARLVVTVTADGPALEQELDRYVLDLHDEPVDQLAIVTAHLSWWCNEEEAAKLLESEAVKELIGDLGNAEYSCRAAADLARNIQQEWADQGIVTTGGVWRRQRRRVPPLNRWFDGLRTAEDRSFAIALAALDGLSYEEVSDGARRLRTRLAREKQPKPATDAADKPEPRAEPLSPSAAMLDRLRAQTFSERLRYTYGLVPARTVRYRNDDYPKDVIELAWQGYHIQPTLIEWLGELVTVKSESVRFYAASALGVMARQSFEYLRMTFVQWADSDDYRVREAVAYALLEPVKVPELKLAVRAVVAGWYSNHGSRNQQATAARAYGIGIGGFGIDTVLDRLGRLATAGDFVVSSAIGDALADLVLDDPATNAPLVLNALLGWLDHHQRVRPAQLAFIIVATSLVEWIPKDEDDALGTPWPMLLHLARTVEAVRDPMVALWSRLIARSVLFEEAQDAITGWAGLAEKDSVQLRMYVLLILQIAQRDPRAHDVLRRRIKQWIDPTNLNPLPQAERMVREQLARLDHGGR